MRSARHAPVTLLVLLLTLSAVLAQAPLRADDHYDDAVDEILATPAGLAFLDAYLALQRDYLYGVERDALLRAATAGMMDALGDPFSRYLGPPEAEAARAATASANAVEIAVIGKVALIRIATFEGDAIGAHFSGALDTLILTGSRGFVLDLRGNPGGSILQGLQVLDRFLGEGELGYRRVRGVSVPIAYANPRAVSEPLIVLVDADTASTAEIVAGTLQAYGRARIVGTVTAGKGVGQTAVRLPDGAELRIVSFEWLLPGLRSVDRVGLTPDVLVSVEPPDPVSDGLPTPLIAVPGHVGDIHLRLALELLQGLLGDAAGLAEIMTPAVVPGPAAGPNGPSPAATSTRPDPGAPAAESGPADGAADENAPPPNDGRLTPP
jgi:C-terminal processing protease CtpA/Prc